ncbi:MAG: tRNA lysidine(34) synthetase TilS [Thermomicrobiales bacterium]
MRSATGEVGVVQRLRRTLADARFAPHPHILAGFSGGADSLALLAALRELERLGLLRLTALHVDHGIRETSSSEALVVAGVAASLDVPCEIWTIDPAALARHRGVGPEEALRRERYRAFATVAARLGTDIVATGHHQRDQAETVLLHLLRGAGLHGVSGMRPWSELAIPWWDEPGDRRTIRLWRPLLDEPADVLRMFAESQHLPIIEDPSNDDSLYRRNAIRNEVLPVLEAVMPGSVANIARFAGLAAEDDDALDALAADLVDRAPDRDALPLALVAQQPVALQRRVLRTWVLARIPRLELSSQRVEALHRACLRGEGGKRIQLGEGWTGVIERSNLTLDREG